MHFRKVVAFLLSVGSLFFCNLRAENIFVQPVGGSPNQPVQVYSANAFSRLGSFNAPVPALQAVAAPNGSNYYMLTGTQDPGLLVLDGTNPAIVKSNVVLPDTPTRMIMAPDGGRILIFFPSGVQQYIPATNTLSPVASEGNIGTRPVTAVFSEDGTRAYFLSDTSKRVTSWNFANANAEAFLNIGNTSFTSITLSPRNGMLYVSALNFIYEIDPAKFELKNSISVNGQPDNLFVTSDANLLVARNTRSFTNAGLFVVTIGDTTRNVSIVPLPSNREVLTDLSPVTPTRVIARGQDTGTVYDITLSPVGLSNLVATGSVPGSVQSLAVTDQVPAARYLFAFSAAGLQRLDLNANPNAWNPAAAASTTNATISFAAANTQLPPATIQSLTPELRGNPNAILQTVTIRVLDQNGRPTARVAINWNVTNTGLTLVTKDSTTNASGWARATYRAPASAFTGSVTIGAGNATPVQLPVTVGENVGGSTNGPGVFIVSGTGIVIPNGNAAPLPLTVFVRGNDGQPAIGAKVLFKITRGPLFLNLPVIGGNVYGTGCEYDADYNATCTTDSSGRTSVIARGNSITTGDSFLPATVTASANGNTATFRMTVIGGTQFVPPDRQLLTPDPLGDTVITVNAGATVPGAIKIRFTAGAVGGLQDGRPMPNVGFTVTDPADPATHCDGEAGVALSVVKPYDPNSFGDDPNDGVASCNLVVGNSGLGNRPLQVVIFGQYQLPGYFISLNILPPAASAITATTGNGTSGVTGANINLQATVTGVTGQALANQSVAWRVVSGDITLKNIGNLTDQLGRVSATATLGTKTGAAVVEASVGALKALFNITIQAPVTTLRKVDQTDNQTASTDDTFAAPLQVQVIGPDGKGASGQVVTFSVVSGPVTLINTSSTTDVLGLASASVKAGSAAGSAVIQASVGTLTQTFTLTVKARGIQAQPNDFTNSFSGVRGTLSPGGIYTLTTRAVAPNVVGTQLTNRFFAPYPTSFNGVTIKINDVNATILSATNANNVESVTFQVPWESATPASFVTVKFNVNGVDTQINVPLAAVQPAFLTFADGSKAVPTIVDTDGNIIRNLSVGKRYRAVVGGLGQTTPQQFTGKLANPAQIANNVVAMKIGGSDALVGTVEAVANQLGLYYVTFDVPATLTPGTDLNLELRVTIPGVSDSVANPVKVTVVP